MRAPTCRGAEPLDRITVARQTVSPAASACVAARLTRMNSLIQIAYGIQMTVTLRLHLSNKITLIKLVQKPMCPTKILVTLVIDTSLAVRARGCQVFLDTSPVHVSS